MCINRRNFLRNSVLGTGILFPSVTGYGSVKELKESIERTQKKVKIRRQVFPDLSLLVR